jgi:NADH:ubiquinone oxidoreductase subunit 6 (subunit J)
MKTTTKPLPQSPQKTALVGLGLGCVVPTLILAAAILLGLWLDKTLENSKHLYTIGLIIVSVPLTAVALVWSVRLYSSQRTNAKQEMDKQRENLQEDADSDAD